MKKKDGRRNNGAASQGLQEDAQLVRGSSDLLEAMRELAIARGQPISNVWREAAVLLLTREGKLK